jgi:hypothetical protein
MRYGVYNMYTCEIYDNKAQVWAGAQQYYWKIIVFYSKWCSVESELIMIILGKRQFHVIL